MHDVLIEHDSPTCNHLGLLPPNAQLPNLLSPYVFVSFVSLSRRPLHKRSLAVQSQLAECLYLRSVFFALFLNGAMKRPTFAGSRSLITESHGRPDAFSNWGCSSCEAPLSGEEHDAPGV